MTIKRHGYGFLVLVIALMLAVPLMAACSPQASPTPTRAAPAAAASSAPTQSATPAANATQSAWDNVVANAKKEGTLTIYSSAFVSDISRRISSDFQKQYGIRVGILAGGGSQLLEKVRVEQKIGKPIGDIMGSSGGSISQLVMDGLGAPTAQELPELRDKSKFISEPVYSPGGEIIVFALQINPAMINTNLIKPQDEPKSWMDFLAPKWKGKILTPDPRATGSSAFYYSMRFFKVIDLDYIRKLAKQDMALWAGNNREGLAMVARGEYSSFLFGPVDGMAPLIVGGAPVKPVGMKEGVIASSQSNAMVKNAPHPNAAKLFLNWMLTPEGQAAYHEVAGMMPFRKGMPDFTVPQARLPDIKVIARTWESEEWADKELKAGTMADVFGDK